MEGVIREVLRIVSARGHRDSNGIVARRLIPTAELGSADPFSLLEEIGPSDCEPGEAEGGPVEHQQGVDVLTLLVSGELEYAHSPGKHCVLEAGQLLWTVAGSGTDYSERLSRRIAEQGGRVHGLRFRVDLPDGLESSPPRSLKVPGAELPWLEVSGHAARVRVLAGEAFGTRSVIGTGAEIEAQDWLIDAGADVTIPLPEHHRAMVYVCCESAWVGDEGLGIRNGQLALLAQGKAVRLRGAASTLQPARLLLLSGKPLRKNRQGGAHRPALSEGGRR